MRKIITSLDVGSDSIKLVVGEIHNKALNVLASLEVKSKGVKKGIIVTPEEAIISFKEIIKNAETIIGIKIKRLIVCVPSYYAEFIDTEGYTLINREEHIVNASDIVRALQACVYNRVNPNDELVSIMPYKYILNDDKIVIDPKNMKANKLTIQSRLCIVPNKNVFALYSILESMGIEVLDVILHGYADYFEYKNNDIARETGAIINIGASITNVSIISSGIMQSTNNLDFGSKTIDKELIYFYNLYKAEAVYLKEKIATCFLEDTNTNETERILTKDGKNIKINQYEVSKIVSQIMSDAFNKIKVEINHLTNKEINYIIITGGCSEMAGFKSFSESILGKKVIILDSLEFGARHKKYSSVLGAIKYYNEKLSFREQIATTFEENEINEMFSMKKKINNNVLGKIYGYFFDN